MFENHPLVLVSRICISGRKVTDFPQIFYMTVTFCAQVIFIYAAWSRLTSFHQILCSFVIFAPYPLTYLTVTSTSSVITTSNHAKAMRQYPFDYVLFYPGQICQTCRLPKPARSKHCRLCNVCTAKSDHHCLWVMNCISRDNYIWFLAMIASLGVMLAYGSCVAYTLLSRSLVERNNPWPKRLSYSNRLDMWFETIARDPNLGCTGLLAAFTTPLAWGLFAYHMYLIWAGMTTSESFKWDEWRDDVADGYVYKRVRVQDRARKMPKLRMTQHEHTEEIDSDSWSSLRAFDQDELDPHVSWPAESKTFLINTLHRASSDQEPGADLSSPLWSRLNNLAEATNIYDLGFTDNLWDVMRWAFAK